MAEYKQGFFKPKNPKKYRGDPTNIIFRSDWERKVMRSLDENLNIVSWGSEEIVIPYKSPVDNKIHRYYVDFYVEAIDKSGSVKTMLLEVKPHAQTLEPKRPKRNTRRYLTEVVTYGVNQAKWKAAEEYCSHMGWQFMILTEKELFNKK